MTLSAQKRFTETYISSREIIERLQVSRPTISQARKRGMLPDPIVIEEGLIYLWERATVEPFIAAWAIVLKCKKSNQK